MMASEEKSFPFAKESPNERKGSASESMEKLELLRWVKAGRLAVVAVKASR